MDKIGIVKKIDNLGRLVIPKEMRKLFGLDDKAELIVTKEGVLVRAPQKRKKIEKYIKQKRATLCNSLLSYSVKVGFLRP